MSHEVESMAFAVEDLANIRSWETPWHNTNCTPIKKGASPQEMLRAAGLDWRVEKVPLYYTFNGETFPSTDCALIRETDGHELTTISGGWHPVQNHTAFEFFDRFCADGELTMETAGSLKHGQMVWVLARMTKSFSLFKGKDETVFYMLFSNPHQYGRKIVICLTPIRVVCNNTITLALNKAGRSDYTINLHHRTAFDVEEVQAIMALAFARADSYKEKAELLASRRFNNEDLTQYFKSVFHAKGDENKELSKVAQKAIEAMVEQPGAELGGGTWWQAVNAVTFTTDHLLGRSDDTRLYSAWYGPNRARKEKAFELAVEFAERSSSN